jgi:hypothetical protein
VSGFGKKYSEISPSTQAAINYIKLEGQMGAVNVSFVEFLARYWPISLCSLVRNLSATLKTEVPITSSKINRMTKTTIITARKVKNFPGNHLPLPECFPEACPMQ